jgi:hypothetical protein
MIETYRICKRAYEHAYVKFTTGISPGSLSSACKRFVLKAVAEVNRGRLASVQQVQKYMGQGWPLDKVSDDSPEKELCTRAFLFALKSLNRYVTKPYRPDGAEVVAVALKVRARVAHVRVYLEDTIDLILWYPKERRLELIDFQMQPLKPINPAWPNASMLVKSYLAERLKVRWPYEKLSLTTYRVGTQDHQPVTVLVDEPLYRAHWEDVVRALEEMKVPPTRESACSAAPNATCKHCLAIKKASILDAVTGHVSEALSA